MHVHRHCFAHYTFCLVALSLPLPSWFTLFPTSDAKWRYKMHRRFGNTAFFRVARRITSSLFVVVCHYELKCFENVNWHAPKICARVCVIHRKEKSRFIPWGASVRNLKKSLISSRWRTSFFDSPDFIMETRASSSEWPGLLK